MSKCFDDRNKNGQIEGASPLENLLIAGTQPSRAFFMRGGGQCRNSCWWALVRSSYWNSRWVNSCCSCKVIQKNPEPTKERKASLKGLWLMLLSYGGLMPRGNINRKSCNYAGWGCTWNVAADTHHAKPMIRLPWPEKCSEVMCPYAPRHRWAGTSGGEGTVTRCFKKMKCWRFPGLPWATYTEWLLQSSTCSPTSFFFCS